MAHGNQNYSNTKNNHHIFQNSTKISKHIFENKMSASECSFQYHKCPFSLKISIVLCKWLPSRFDHLENIYVPTSRRKIKPSTSSLFSTSTINLSTGRSRYLSGLLYQLTPLTVLHFVQHLYRLYRQQLLLPLATCFFPYHPLLVQYLQFHNFLFCHSTSACSGVLIALLFSTYLLISAGVKTLGGGITTLDFIVSSLIGLSGTGLVTSLITSNVKGGELTITSTSVNKVCKETGTM